MDEGVNRVKVLASTGHAFVLFFRFVIVKNKIHFISEIQNIASSIQFPRLQEVIMRGSTAIRIETG